VNLTSTTLDPWLDPRRGAFRPESWLHVFEEWFTRAEKTLAARGEREAIQHVRRRFQQQMADEFTSVVKQATGRKVKVFLSETDIDQHVSVELFLLAEERTDMTGFEDA
jgi:uncharacterized protein YbcI